MPLVAKDGKLIIRKVFGGQPMLAGSEDCCCPEECIFGCLKPTQWRIAETDSVYASGPVSDAGELDLFPSPWIAYWYTKTELELKLEVEFPDGWKTLEEWQSTISICGAGPFASHTWGDVDPAPDPPQPPWPVPEPYDCQMAICPPTEPGEVRKWWISAARKEAIDKAIVDGREPPECACGYGKEDPVVESFGPYDSLKECQEAMCPPETVVCIPCYLDIGSPYEPKVAPPEGDYTFSGDVDGEWNNARNWFDEYDLPPTATNLTLGADATTLTGSVPVLSPPGGGITTLTIPAGFKLAVEITASPVNGLGGGGGQVACFGEIAATSDCEGKRGQVNGFVYFYGSGHLGGAVLGAAGFRDQSYTESGSVIAASPDVGPSIDGYSNGWFVFFGSSTNKAGCDSSGASYLAFANDAKNQADVGANVEFWENSRNDTTGVTGDSAYFNGRNVEAFGDSLSQSINVGQGSMPRTGGNYGTVTGSATFLNDSDNYNIVTGNSTFANADNETGGTVDGNGTFGVVGEPEEDAAFNKGTVKGDGTFFGHSQNSGSGTVEGDGEFSGESANHGTVEGDGEFSESSTNGSDDDDAGTIEGNATFDGSSANWATVDGDATFSGGSSQGDTGVVSGDATINGSAVVGGTVEGDVTASESGRIEDATVNGDAAFSGQSEATSGNIEGNATFSGSSTAGGDEEDTLTVGGTVTFSETTANNGTLDASGTVTFSGNSTNNGIVAGNATFEDGATNAGTVQGNATFATGTSNSGTIEGNATFATGTSNSGPIEGNATFAGTATNSGSVGGTATFSGTSTNAGTIDTAQFEGSSSNTSAGIVTNGTFSGSASNAGEVTNGTFGGSSSNSGVVTNGTFSSSATNAGEVTTGTFSGSSANNGSVSTGTFSGSASNAGTSTGGTFTGSSSNDGTVGTGTFGESSSNNSLVGGNATFGGSSGNNGNVYGSATFNDSSNNFGFVAGIVTCNTTGTC